MRAHICPHRKVRHVRHSASYASSSEPGSERSHRPSASCKAQAVGVLGSKARSALWQVGLFASTLRLKRCHPTFLPRDPTHCVSGWASVRARPLRPRQPPTRDPLISGHMPRGFSPPVIFGWYVEGPAKTNSLPHLECFRSRRVRLARPARDKKAPARARNYLQITLGRSNSLAQINETPIVSRFSLVSNGHEQHPPQSSDRRGGRRCISAIILVACAITAELRAWHGTYRNPCAWTQSQTELTPAPIVQNLSAPRGSTSPSLSIGLALAIGQGGTKIAYHIN